MPYKILNWKAKSQKMFLIGHILKKMCEISVVLFLCSFKFSSQNLSLELKPASALSLPTVWSTWGNPGVARCREMATLPAGYIPQRKLPSASSSGSLFHCVCEVL